MLQGTATATARYCAGPPIFSRDPPQVVNYFRHCRMSMQPRETFQSLLAAAKQGTKRASDRASSPSEGNGTSLGVLDGTNAASVPRYDETTRTRPPAKGKTDTATPILNEDKAAPSTPSVEVNSATPLSQEDNLVEVMRSFEGIQMDKHPVDSQPPKQDNKATSSQATVTAQPPRSIEDEPPCEHKVIRDSKCWR